MAAEARAIEDHKRQFLDFLESENHEGKYVRQLQSTISDQKYRLIVNVNDIRNFDTSLASDLVRRPREYIMALREAATETAKIADPSVAKLLKQRDLQVGFEGSFGSNVISPRGLLSSFLNSMVEVEGIVTKTSTVKPKMLRSVQFCPNTGKYKTMDHRDETSPDIYLEVNGRITLPTNGALPREDADQNELELEQGLSVYKDYQTIILQEMPERARVGQLPRSIEVILEYDLVDRVKPGDRVKCVGVFQPFAGGVNQGTHSGMFNSKVIANNISIIGKEVGAVRLTGEDVSNIKEVGAREGVLEIMSRSLCPSIFGHEFIKKALILQLLGGCERNLENGTHLRGDINVMMVGDPSTAKSQLLRAVMDIAPLAISTTGRGSSGVGLTAAVTVELETGEKRLEAGAMVLADRGVVCIDEFDKMGENDRVAIHEVMEQQTVTIAKAGIHASLNARCSVLAAANPVYGQYDRSRRPQENIGLPDSLLSRFDLLFIVLDQLDPAHDRYLSEHVIRSHQYRRPGTIMEPEALNQTTTIDLNDPAEVLGETPVWQKGGRGTETSRGDGRAGDVLTKDFLRKYIHYAKNRVHPVLSEVAMENISTAYADMRAKQSQKNLPVTARSLETIIRLSSASAKARLSPSVDEEDVELATELMNYVLFHEIGSVVEGTAAAAALAAGAAGRRSGGSGSASASASAGGADEEKDEEEEVFGSSSSRGRKRLRRGREGHPEEDEDFEDDPSEESKRAAGQRADPERARLELLLSEISSFAEETSREEFDLAALLTAMRGSTVPAVRQLAGQGGEAIRDMVLQLQANNKVMFIEGEDDESSTILIL